MIAGIKPPLSHPLLVARNAWKPLYNLPGRAMLLLCNEGSGNIIKNAWALGQNPVNLLYSSEQALSQWWRSNTGCTVTDNFEANPVDGVNVTATRIQMAAGASSVGPPDILSANGVTWTFSAYIKAADAASCNLRFFRSDTGAFTAFSTQNPALQPGVWQRVLFTLTTSGTGFTGFRIANDGTNAADISVYGVTLEKSASMSAFQPPALHMVFPLNTPTTWTSTGITTTSIATFAAAIRQTPLASFGNMTVHVAFKQSGSAPQNAAFLMQHLTWGDVKAQMNAANYNQVQLRFSGDANGCQQRLVTVTDDAYHVYTFVVESAGVERVYIDGALAGVINQTITPFTHHGWNLGGQFNTNSMKGEWGCVAAFDAAHTGDQVLAGYQGVRSIMASKGVTLP